MHYKILYIVSTLERGGPTSQLFNVIKNLDRTTFEAILLTLSPEPQNSMWLEYKNLGINIHSLDLSRWQGLFIAKSKVKLIIEKIQPDLIHSQGFRADVLLSKITLNNPHIATIHNFPQVDYYMTYGRIIGWIMLKTHKNAMLSIDRLIGCSNSVAKNLIENFLLKNVVEIQNGVDQEIFRPPDKIRYSKNGELCANQKNWISTGHLSKRKDPLFLIRAWKIIEEKHPNHHLFILGSGHLSEDCNKLKSKSKNIHLLGHVTNVVDFLKNADYFITASQSEGLPMAAIEAMACGLPLLVTDIEPYKELFELSDKIGRTFKLGDMSSFLTEFEAMIEMDYNTISKASLDIANSKLNAKTMSMSYQVSYKELLEV